MPLHLFSKWKYWITPHIVDHLSSTIPSPLPPPHIKGVGSFIIYSPPSFEYLLCNNSFSPELQSLPLPLLIVWLHPSLRFPELRLVWSPESPSSFLNIHGELPCITVIARSNSDEFLPLQVHRESKVSHSLQFLHPVHTIFYTKINSNSRTLHQHHSLFKKLCSNLWIKFSFRDILRFCRIAWGYQLVNM
jgi:hypothetical protein